MADLLGPVTPDIAQKSGDKHNCRQVHEPKHENRQSENDDVAPVEKRECQRWIRIHDPPDPRGSQQEYSGGEQRHDKSGVEPVESLALVERCVEQAETEAEIRESP